MKRHKSLIPLSHDHHHGLILAQLIKSDIPTLPNQPQTVNEKVEHVKKAWKEELEIHFENEENILFPTVKGRDKKLDIFISNILDEHKQIEKMIKSLNKNNNLEEKLNELGILLEDHIRKEERELFQLIQEVMGNDLDNLKGKIIAVKDSCSM